MCFNYQLIITFKNQLQVNYEQLHKGGGRGEKIDIFFVFFFLSIKIFVEVRSAFPENFSKG